MFKKLAAAIAALAALIGGWFIIKPDNPPPVIPGFAVEQFDAGAFGDMAVLTGVSVRDPLHRDSNGNTVNTALADAFFSLPVHTYRHTAGSHSYKIKSSDDIAMRFAMSMVNYQTWRGRSVKQDFTWPPQLPDGDVGAWVTAATGRISLPNEPPNHIGPAKQFATPQDYVSKCEAIYDNPANAAFRDKFWIQSGKPEVVEGGSASEKTRHLAVQTALQEAVSSGRLPNRIITTHKLLPEYNAVDWYAWYRDLIGDYQDIYGQGTKICFQEWNWPESELSQDGVLAMAHFFLVLSRLRDELGPVVDGACYHQLSSVAKEVVNEDKSIAPPIFALRDGVWGETGLAAVWREFGVALVDGGYVRTAFAERPEDLALEIFQFPGGEKFVYWSNRGAELQVALRGETRLLVTESGSVGASQVFDGMIPARSVGVAIL